jgi:hypothetical protein
MLGALLAVFSAAAADVSDIAARAATWEKEYNANNLDAVVALYAADGCRMPPLLSALVALKSVRSATKMLPKRVLPICYQTDLGRGLTAGDQPVSIL